MKIESRLKQLEKATGPGQAAFIRRPADVPKAIWRRAMELLAEYSPDVLYPWTSLQDLAESCRTTPQTEWEKLFHPIVDVVERARFEAETGELLPDWITSIPIHLANMAEMPETTLVRFLRAINKGLGDYCLPSPYSVEVLRQVADEDTLTRCMEFADKLRRGEITTEEHTAELAKFLPPITRADQEKAMRTFLEQFLPANRQTSSVPALEAGNG